MKKTIFLLIILSTLLFTGCSSIKTLNYNSLEKKLNNKESFILEVARTDCSHCQDFTPRFDKLLKKYNLTAYKVYTDKFTKREKQKFDSKIYVGGTPTIVFIKNGKETDTYNRIVGAVPNSKIIKRLKQLKYIK